MRGEKALVGLVWMSHNYNLYDIKCAILAGIAMVSVCLWHGFMSHKMGSDVQVVPGRGWGVCPFFSGATAATSARKIQTSWWTRVAVNLLLLWVRLLRGPGSCCDLVTWDEVTW
jgi:hypothetical protein